MRHRLLALLMLAALGSGCPSPDPSSSSTSAPPSDAAPVAPTAPTDETAQTDETGQTAETAPTPAAAEPVAIEQRELPVKCGCKLEVKKCSEWAEVDGRWVRLVGDHGMGHMPFCGKEGLRARISGQLKGDELHLTSIQMVP